MISHSPARARSTAEQPAVLQLVVVTTASLCRIACRRSTPVLWMRPPTRRMRACGQAFGVRLALAHYLVPNNQVCQSETNALGWMAKARIPERGAALDRAALERAGALERAAALAVHPNRAF